MKTLVLCQGRHEMPEAAGAIFSTTIDDPTDVKGLYDHAVSVLEKLDDHELRIYVTGMTVALIAAINACFTLGIRVILLHYDRNTGDYYGQRVWFPEELY